MSARDSASGSSDWKGGGGGMTANGGIGGGMGGGLGGGGAGRNGGYGSPGGNGVGGGPVGGIAGAVVPVRPVKNLFVPPPVRYKMAPPVAPVAPPKYPVGTLARAMRENIFNAPAAPAVASEVPDEVVPGFGQAYVAPASVSLTNPNAKPINDRVPTDPNFPGNNFDPKTRQVGQGKTYTDRVPQGSGFGQSAIKF